MMRHISFIMVLLLSSAFPLYAADLPAAPPSGVDIDLSAAVDEAREVLASGHPESATKILVRLHSQSDRFAVAQRVALRAPSQQILQAAANALEAAGQHEDAAIALDAAWDLEAWTPVARPPSPALARVLLHLSDTRQPRGERLWLVRRALSADPSNPLATKLDRELAANQLRRPAIALMVIGASISIGAGVLLGLSDQAQSGSLHDDYRVAGAFGLSFGIGTLIAGGGLFDVGQRSDVRPVSPASLPALPEAKP